MSIVLTQFSAAIGSPNKAYASPNVLGNTLVCCVQATSVSGTETMSDTAGNTGWTQIVRIVGGPYSSWWACFNCKAAASNTVTPGFSGATSNLGLTVGELSGAGAVNTFGSSTNGNVSGLAVALTTTVNNCYILYGSFRGGGGATWSAVAPWTPILVGTGGGLQGETGALIGAAGSYTPLVTPAGSGSAMSSTAIALQPSLAGGNLLMMLGCG